MYYQILMPAAGFILGWIFPEYAVAISPHHVSVNAGMNICTAIGLAIVFSFVEAVATGRL